MHLIGKPYYHGGRYNENIMGDMSKSMPDG